MQGTSPGVAATGQPVAWPSRRGHAARQSQEPALGSGRPAPPTSRSCLRAVPVSNGESISTASARGRARPAPHLFPAFPCPQAVHRIWLVIRITSWFSTVFCTGHQQATRRYPRNTELLASRHALFLLVFRIRFPVSADERPRLSGEILGIFPAVPLHATMRMISRGRRHCCRRVRPGEGR